MKTERFDKKLFKQEVLNNLKTQFRVELNNASQQQIYQAVAEAQLNAWKKGSGYFYWSYKLLTDTVNEAGWVGWDSWDFGRCAAFGWFPADKEEMR